MSVENQAVESTTEDVHEGENQKAKSVDEESLNSTISDSSSKEESGSVGYQATAMTGNLSQKNPVSGSRKWFEQLEASERVAALTIADTPFLGALLAVASWSPTKERSGLVGAIDGKSVCSRLSRFVWMYFLTYSECLLELKILLDIRPDGFKCVFSC